MTGNAVATQTEATRLRTQQPEPLLDAKLSELLASGVSKVVGPKTAAALRAYVDGPWPELALPTAERMESMVGRLALATRERRLSEAEADERLDLYWRALRDIPLIDLAAGFDTLLTTCTFMPTPAEVRTTCRGYTARREYRRSRARYLLLRHDREWVAPVEPVPAEEVAGLLGGLRTDGSEAVARG